MEAVTAGATGAKGTGSKTIADLLPLAVKKHGDKAAQRYKVGDEWVDSSYAELGEAVKEVALGLVDLGIQPGDKISILAHTRPEWTHACFGILTAGATLVTIYQTNSPEECQYVLEHSDSRAMFVEDGDQLAKVREVEDKCPELEHIVVMDAGDGDIGDALSLDTLRERGRGRDDSEWTARYEAVTPDDICLYIYTSGTTGPPKGCLLSHANYRAITDAVLEDSVLEEGDSSYLFLPLAHAFAILIQFATFELGAALAYWSRDPKMIIADITQVNPSFFPSVPRMFEKIYTLATSNIEDKEQLRQAVQFGAVGKPQMGVEAKIADDGEVLIKGPNIFQGYYKNEDATKETLEGGWLHTGDLGRLDEDGFLYITGRKKDIIITAGGKNITPANLENGLKQNRWISQAVVVGDRRPYLIALITLDPEEAPALAEQVGAEDASLPALAQNEAVRAEVQQTVDEVNSHVGPVEQIKRFEILDHDLSQETGELTPTLKVKRNVVHEKFADVVDRVYDAPR